MRFPCRLASPALALATLCSIASAETLTLEMSGMLAFIEERNRDKVVGYTLILPNMWDQQGSAMHPVVHTPLLEVRCADLRDSVQSRDCESWRPVTTPGYGSIPLHQGYDMVLDIEEDTPALKIEESFNECTRRLKELAGSQAGTARQLLADQQPSKELREYAIARLKIAGGKLKAQKDTNLIWEWPGNEAPIYNADSITLTRRLPSSGLTIELKRFSDNTSKKYSLLGGRDVTVKISNDPHKLDYCDHKPTSRDRRATHFYRFYDLSQVPAHQIPSLPVPHSKNPDAICPNSSENLERIGLRVNCDAVVLAPPR